MAATSKFKEKFEDYEGFVEKFKPKRNRYYNRSQRGRFSYTLRE